VTIWELLAHLLVRVQNNKTCAVQRIKVIEAQQAKIYNYKNTKLKLLTTNGAIWFNKICETKQLTPKYLSIKINGINRQNLCETF